MTLPTPLVMMGAPGSPYTRKMRAVLRYRRIPYRFILQHSPEAAKLPAPKVRLLPTFYLPNEAGGIVAVTDSTPLIRRFEQEIEGRSIVPPDPAVAFLDELVEDYADEWLTKCRFHYRWYHEVDAKKARRILPHWAMTDVSDEEIAPIQKMIGDRQIGRLSVVGSNDVTAAVIEDSYRRFLDAFDAQLQASRFLFGRRPSSSDFAMMGQLTCLAFFDPTPSALTAGAIASSLRLDRGHGRSLGYGAGRRRLVGRGGASRVVPRHAGRGRPFPCALSPRQRRRARAGRRASRNGDRWSSVGTTAVPLSEEMPRLAARQLLTPRYRRPSQQSTNCWKGPAVKRSSHERFDGGIHVPYSVKWPARGKKAGTPIGRPLALRERVRERAMRCWASLRCCPSSPAPGAPS